MLNLVVVAVLRDSIGIRYILYCVTGCYEVESYDLTIIKRIIIIIIIIIILIISSSSSVSSE